MRSGVNRLVKFDSGLKALFAEATQIIQTDNQVNEPSLPEVDEEEAQPDNLTPENMTGEEESTHKNKRSFFGCFSSLFKRNK